jgi:hypothetical protein
MDTEMDVPEQLLVWSLREVDRWPNFAREFAHVLVGYNGMFAVDEWEEGEERRDTTSQGSLV